MEELDLKELFILFWNKKVTVILIILIFIGIGIIYSIGFVTPTYTSSTTLVLATQQDSTDETITATEITLNSKLISTYSELIKSKNVLRKVISNLNINIDENNLRKNIAVTAVSDTELIKISITNTDPKIAAQVANQMAIVFTEQIKAIYNINNVHVVDEAEIEETPSNINHTKDVIIFAFIGIIISIIYVLLENTLDTTVKTTEDIEKQISIPVLAAIPLDIYNTKKGGKR